MAGFPHIFSLTFVADIVTMSIESERGTENPFQVSPCATGVAGSGGLLIHCVQQEKELRFRYSRVVQLRPRDA